jgi:hypothetical protein
MRRLRVPAFLVAVSTAGAVLAVAACDPDLTVAAVHGEGGAEGGAAEGGPPPVADSAPPQEAGPDDASAEAGQPEHVIDGINDFSAGDKFATTSSGYDAYISWDAKKVYFGMSGADIGGGSSSKWVLVYVDGVPDGVGSSTGSGYDCFGACPPLKASLPFNAGYHLRWKADGSYTNLQKWTLGAWAGPGTTISTSAQKGTFWEASVLRSLLGSPSKLKVHVSMLIEAAPPTAWNYAGVPSTSFTDGAPVTFTKYFEFDLTDTTKAPNTYAPK